MRKKILTVLGIIVAVIIVFYFILFLTKKEKMQNPQIKNTEE